MVFPPDPVFLGSLNRPIGAMRVAEAVSLVSGAASAYVQMPKGKQGLGMSRESDRVMTDDLIGSRRLLSVKAPSKGAK